MCGETVLADLNARGEPLSVWPLAHRLVLKAIFQVCFGDDPDERLPELLDVVEAMMAFNDDFVVLLSTQELSQIQWPEDRRPAS